MPIIQIVPANQITVSEAAEQLGIDRDAVLMAIHRGTLAVAERIVTRGKTVMILLDQAEVDRYRDENAGKRGRPAKRNDGSS